MGESRPQVEGEGAGDRNVNAGTITISAMVRVGPWTVESVAHGPWRQCDRCNARHREVWTCTVDADAEELSEHLNGQRTWRIGSTCGPLLMQVSDEIWKNETKATQKTLRLLLDARRAIHAADEYGIEYWALPHIIERADLLRRGELCQHLTRWLRGHVNELLNLVRRKKKSSPPTPP